MEKVPGNKATRVAQKLCARYGNRRERERETNSHGRRTKPDDPTGPTTIVRILHSGLSYPQANHYNSYWILFPITGVMVQIHILQRFIHRLIDERILAITDPYWSPPTLCHGSHAVGSQKTGHQGDS